ncbi:NADP-dependent oxidoreductase [Solirubrobacter soli]|uniref:NADP-dependent oxidoreductase n=1 Tax=Solirubrobacter soli TaxID=363832 RepID=UPI00048404BA|nr:NADP-dependent oxidoreductase [Solirubrobacter soli]
MTWTSREIRLASRPVGEPQLSDFELAEVEIGDPDDGEVVVRNTFMSVDPYMRGRMNDAPSYQPPFQLGAPLEGAAVGEVVASRHERFAEGDVVTHQLGWREYAKVSRGLRKVAAEGIRPSAFLGVLGMPGLTAYVGLLDIAELREDDVVFVSGAAGAVGSLVGQIAKLRGHTVIGSAGTAEKVAWLREIGFDAAFDYHDGVKDQLKAAAPDGIDVYFDNVGGEHLEAAISRLHTHGRVALCGMISAYNATEPPAAPRNLIQAVGKRLTLRGFIILDHFDRLPAFLGEIAPAVAAGEIKFRETIVEGGVDAAPQAFLDLLHGANVGKMLVAVG